MIRTCLTILVINIALTCSLRGEAAPLTKVVNGLNEFYAEYTKSAVSQNGQTGRDFKAFSGLFRDAIVHEFVNDTLWVKLFITTREQSNDDLNQLRLLHLRGLAKFGDILSAIAPIEKLPEIDALDFVRCIEPVVPDGMSAGASIEHAVPVPDVKKK